MPGVRPGLLLAAQDGDGTCSIPPGKAWGAGAAAVLPQAGLLPPTGARARSFRGGFKVLSSGPCWGMSSRCRPAYLKLFHTWKINVLNV